MAQADAIHPLLLLLNPDPVFCKQVRLKEQLYMAVNSLNVAVALSHSKLGRILEHFLHLVQDHWILSTVIFIVLCLFLVNELTQTITHALYNLAAYPEYIEPLRKEIEPLVANGWAKSNGKNVET